MPLPRVFLDSGQKVTSSKCINASGYSLSTLGRRFSPSCCYLVVSFFHYQSQQQSNLSFNSIFILSYFSWDSFQISEYRRLRDGFFLRPRRRLLFFRALRDYLYIIPEFLRDFKSFAPFFLHVQRDLVRFHHSKPILKVLPKMVGFFFRLSLTQNFRDFDGSAITHLVCRKIELEFWENLSKPRRISSKIRSKFAKRRANN